MTGRVLIDTSNLRAGGGLQVGSSLVDELAVLARDGLAPWSWFGSLKVEASKEVVENCVQDLSRLDVDVVVGTPLRRLSRGPTRRKYDVSFTVFGPEYSFRRARRRIVGFADVTSLRPEFAQTGASLGTRVRHAVRRRASRFLFRRADCLVVEAGHVADDLAERWGVSAGQVSIVPNVVNGAFAKRPPRLELPETSLATFCYPTRAYPHKNLGVLGAAAAYLKEASGAEVRFVLTLTPEEWRALSPETRLCSFNVGPLRVAQMPALYRACTGTVFPSLNECFSVTPLEALACRSPLVGSDRPFVREIAGPAARYFDPASPRSLAEAISDVLTDTLATQRRRDVGERIVAAWPDSADRARAYLDLIDEELRSPPNRRAITRVFWLLAHNDK